MMTTQTLVSRAAVVESGNGRGKRSFERGTGRSGKPGRTSSPRPAAVRVQSHGRTDVGLRRANNQDYLELDDRRQIYLLADGMGGGPRGDLAARLAVDTVHQTMLRRGPLRTRSLERIERAIQRARRRICDEISRDPELIGMGTTVVGLVLDSFEGAVVANVGDSRAYRLRDGHLELLTRDHTMAAHLVSEGHMTKDEADRHPLRHVLTRALCTDVGSEVELVTSSVQAGDLFLLCSDGLSDMLQHEEIYRCLSRRDGLRDACDDLVDEALLRGGHDNITVGLVEILPEKSLVA